MTAQTSGPGSAPVDTVGAASGSEPTTSGPEPTVPTCGACRRERTLGGGAHPMDAYDYSPMQVITGQPFGWYSGDDGEICPEDMERTIRGHVS